MDEINDAIDIFGDDYGEEDYDDDEFDEDMDAGDDEGGGEDAEGNRAARAAQREKKSLENLRKRFDRAILVDQFCLETDEELLVAAARALGAAADTSLPTLAWSTEAVECAGSNNTLVLHQLHAVHRLVQLIPDAALGRAACDCIARACVAHAVCAHDLCASSGGIRKLVAAFVNPSYSFAHREAAARALLALTLDVHDREAADAVARECR